MLKIAKEISQNFFTGKTTENNKKNPKKEDSKISQTVKTKFFLIEINNTKRVKKDSILWRGLNLGLSQ